MLGQWRDERRYAEFLATFPGWSHPFLHEARVHLFRRDHYLDYLKEHLHDPDKGRECATVAFHENGVMETHFSNTLVHSSYVLPPEQVDFLRRRAGPGDGYVSPVSQHLSTRLSEAPLAGIVLAAVAVLTVLERRGRGKIDGPGTP